MQIIKSEKYRIRGLSGVTDEYFNKKYGIPNPIILIEDTDEEVFGGSWEIQKDNIACILFAMRAGLSRMIPTTVYYGKIYTSEGIGLGELVDVSELEAV